MSLTLIRRPDNRELPRINLKQVAWLPLSALANAIRILGGSGTGKTILGAWIASLLFVNNRANLILDPTGSLCQSFISRLIHHCEVNRLSDRQQAELFGKVIYWDLSGHSGYIIPCSLFRRYGSEPLAAVADRVMAWILSSMPESKGAAVEGYNAIAKVMRPASIIAAGLAPEIQVTELPDLLNNHKKGRWKQRFEQALTRYPLETEEAVAFFRREFSQWKDQLRDRRLNLVEVVLQPFRYTPALRATFGASAPGLDYEQIIANGQTVLIDASGLEGEYKQLMLTWILFHSFVSYIRRRGSGRHLPVGLTIDEISTLYMDSPESMALCAQAFGELVYVLRRQYMIHPLTVIHQNVAQLHPKMAAHLGALGNQIIGRPADFDSALLLAQQLFDHRSLVKRWEPIYMHLPERGPQVIDHRPVEYVRDDVLHLQAQTLMRLDTFKFLCRLTQTEGGGQGPLQQLDATSILGPYPNEAKVAAVRHQLIVQSGLPIQQVLAEIEARRHAPGHHAVESDTMPAYDPDGYLLDDE